MNQKQTTTNLKLYAPNLHLFAFHLTKGENKQLLWSKCKEILTTFKIESVLKLDERKIEEEKPYRVDLLKSNNLQTILLPLEGEITLNNKPLTIAGFAYPLRLHDTYILCLNLRRPEQEPSATATEKKDTDPVSIEFFQSLNPHGCFLPQSIGSYLGQTLLLTGWYHRTKLQLPLFNSNPQEIRNLADQCLANFLQQQITLPEFNQAGKLFNSPIFEYGFSSQREGYCHVLVWIFSNPETDVKFQATYQNLINLFAYRNKIIRTYQDSRQLYQTISKEHTNLYDNLDDIFGEMPFDQNLSAKELERVKQSLKRIPHQYGEYLNQIRYLNNYGLTIEINMKNYQRELKDIASQLPEDDLSFLETFLQEDCNLFKEQLKADLGYFQSGRELLEQALNAMRVRAEIDQAERDRIQQEEKEKSDLQLQITLTSVGTGMAVGGIVASSSGQITADNPIYFPGHPEASKPHSVMWVIIISIFCGLIAFGFMRFFFKPKKEKNSF